MSGIAGRLLPVLLFGLVVMSARTGWTAGQATPDEARTMAIKAADYLKANGPDKAFPEFNSRDGPWHDRDLYVFVQNDRGVMMVHGNNPGLNGRNVSDLRDPSGKSISDEVIAIKDTGWVEFQWQNPLTKKLDKKADYVIRVGEYLVGVGAYVP